MPEAKGLNVRKLEQAMDRLFRIGAIERGFLYRDTAEGKDIHGLREVPESSPEGSRKVRPEGSGNPQESTGNCVHSITYSSGADPEGPSAPDAVDRRPRFPRAGIDGESVDLSRVEFPEEGSGNLSATIDRLYPTDPFAPGDDE